MFSFTACSSEDNAASTDPNGQLQPGDVLELTVIATDFVTDGAPDTRATDSGNATTFEEGDRVGVIMLDADNTLIYDNIPYKYNGSKWIFDINNGEGKDACYYDPKATTYIVYYPYDNAADRCKSESDLKKIFSPQTDQSTKANYRASDLMTWSSNPSAPLVKSLNAQLRHAYASISLSPKTVYRLEDGTSYVLPSQLKITDVNLTIGDDVYIPYKVKDNDLRCILPANFTTGKVYCFYTVDDKTYHNTINIKTVRTNTRYSSVSEIIIGNYDFSKAKIGDFYCRKDDGRSGYLIPGDASLTNSQKTSCIGVVIKVGKDSNGDWADNCEYKFRETDKIMDYIHGYVLALHNAHSESLQWAERKYTTGVDQNGRNNFVGYSNTQILKEKDSSSFESNFPAAYYASKGYESQYLSPSNTSGWFMPSAGQCRYWALHSDELLPNIEKAGGDRWLDYYWTSSELNGADSFLLNFTYRAINASGKTMKSGVRSYLAF